jgi:ABC-type branched-subunit amino acid transport system substrate-binding protein
MKAPPRPRSIGNAVPCTAIRPLHGHRGSLSWSTVHTAPRSRLRSPSSCSASFRASPLAPPCAEPLRIGLEAPLTAPHANLGQGMLRAAQLAARDLAARGGVLGRPMEIVPIDDAADPATGVAAATGDRDPATVVVARSDAQGTLHVDGDWWKAVGAGF